MAGRKWVWKHWCGLWSCC